MYDFDGPEYDADAAYERHLESRFDPDAMADLALHESLWPNGYGVCPNGSCHLEVHHPGDCEDLVVEEASTLSAKVRGFRPGHWPAWFRYEGKFVRAAYRVVDVRENELTAVAYRGKGFVVEVLND